MIVCETSALSRHALGQQRTNNQQPLKLHSGLGTRQMMAQILPIVKFLQNTSSNTNIDDAEMQFMFLCMRMTSPI